MRFIILQSCWLALHFCTFILCRLSDFSAEAPAPLSPPSKRCPGQAPLSVPSPLDGKPGPLSMPEAPFGVRASICPLKGPGMEGFPCPSLPPYPASKFP